MTAFTFDARTVAPDEGRVGAIPAGWYPVMGDQAELKPTSNGDGAYINFRCAVQDGPYKGTFVYHRFNTKNASDKAVEIGYKQLSALCHAIGVLTIENLAQLLNRPFFVKLKHVAADGQYDAKNEITAFRPVSDAAAQAGFKESLKGGGAVGGGAVSAPKASPVAPPPVAPASAGWGNAPAAQPAATAMAPATSTAIPNSAPAAAPAQAAPAQPWAQPAAQAPAQAPAAEQPQWAAAPQTQVQAAPSQTAPAQEAPPVAAQAQTGETLPPWMQGGQA